MNDKSFMKLMIDCPNYVREKVLSDGQLELFNGVKCQPDGVTSNFIANLFDISQQGACSRLAILKKKGYLKRTNAGDPTGGDMYIYKAAI